MRMTCHVWSRYTHDFASLSSCYVYSEIDMLITFPYLFSSCPFSLQIQMIPCASTESFELESLYRSSGSKDSVAGIAETGNDVIVIIELLINRTDEDINIGMSFLENFDSLGSCDDAKEVNVLASSELEH